MVSIEPRHLADFIPFNELEERLLQQLALKACEKRFIPGETILRKKRDSPWVNYLLSGEIEVRTSFFERRNITHHDKRARLPLEELTSNEAQVTAVEGCRVVRIALEDIEQARQQNAACAFQSQSLDHDEVADHCVVEDSTLEADWLSEFLHSPLVNHVSARDIQQLLACIEDIEYQAGDEIVRNGQHADFFYIVKSGLAIVHTDPQGPYKGKEFSLMPGGYFGEEALVGDTIRNARVTMETAGTLGRLEPEPFNRFIRDALVVRTSSASINGIIDNSGNTDMIIDVRLYPEYRQNHRQYSTNVPLAMLRERLEQLDPSKNYYITPEGGPRSELATFLMRQAGFNTVLLEESESVTA